VTQAAFGGVPGTESFLIDVTVNGPRGEAFTLTGMRTRYAPRATP
jgi:hypothetical protein